MRASISFVRLSRRAAVLMLLLFVATVTYAQITPSQDAYTNSADPTTNYGTAVTLGVVNTTASIQTAYIQFDLSSIPAGYTSSNIAKATLKLYVNTVTKAGSFNVDFVNGTWTEKKITSSLAPALGTTIVSSVALTSANVKDYVLVDITAAVGEWLDGTQANDGIALVANSPLSATFDSKENAAQSHPPELDIVFAGIAGVATTSGSGLMGGGTSGTLNLSLTNACAANQVLQWNGTAWVCANLGGGGTVTSVGLTAPSTDFIVTGSPVTTSGTLGLGWLVAPDYNNTPGAIVKRDSSGNFSAGTINAATSFNLGGSQFAFGSYANGNVLLGFAGNATMTGTGNTAAGSNALYSNTTGGQNTASGNNALYNNTTGTANTAVGAAALDSNATGFGNTATGASALGDTTTGNYNVASGENALFSDTTGGYNTAVGSQAMYYNTTGSNNTALGYSAAFDQTYTSLTNATAIGANSDVTQSNSLVLGCVAGVNNCPAAVKVGIGTTSPQYALDVHGTGNFTGLVKFASGQQFPGAGTVTSVGSGAGLTGGPITGSGTLSIGTGGVTSTMIAAGTISGSNIAASTITNANIAAGQVAELTANNTFTGTQTINNNVTITAANTTLTASGGTTGVTGTGTYYGVVGNTSGIGQDGVVGNATGADGIGVLGNSTGSNSNGVVGIGSLYGVTGNGTGTNAAGVYGTGPIGVNGTTSIYLGAGVAGVDVSSSGGYGVEGSSEHYTGVYGSSGGLYAGYFYGNVAVTGSLSKSSGSFKIDHPLDPANKYLYHSFVESPDMMNIYNGNVVLDKDGTAWITLPDYFEALNRDFRYQLTAVGAPGPNLYIAQEIANNRFQIAGGTPGGEVSWQVTGIRQDAFAKAHPIIPEVEKTGDERGKYLHPVEHGLPKSLGIDESRRAKMLAQHPEPPKLPERAALPEPPKLAPPMLPQQPAVPAPPRPKPPAPQQHVAVPEPQK